MRQWRRIGKAPDSGSMPRESHETELNEREETCQGGEVRLHRRGESKKEVERKEVSQASDGLSKSLKGPSMYRDIRRLEDHPKVGVVIIQIRKVSKIKTISRSIDHPNHSLTSSGLFAATLTKYTVHSYLTILCR